MTEDQRPIYQPGDVVYGDDPFKGDEDARPWLIISNHEGQPFHGEQYIALTLTTKSWHQGLVELADSDWLRGGAPERSRIVPWGVQSLGRSPRRGLDADDSVHCQFSGRDCRRRTRTFIGSEWPRTTHDT